MPKFKAVCHCVKHEEWFHGEVAKEDLRVASRDEVFMCSTDERHKDRKRKICKACRSRVEVEMKFQKLENQSIVSEPEFSNPEADPVEDITTPVSSLDDVDQQQSSSKVHGSMTPLTTKVPVQRKPTPNKPYQCMSLRNKRRVRFELTKGIENLVYSMTTSDTDISTVISDLIETKYWKSLCGIPRTTVAESQEKSFLSKLAQEYKLCKDKEKNKQIRGQSAKLVKKVKIGSNLKTSAISLDGSSTVGASRSEAAKKLGRIRTYGDERRRLLSIVAWEYSYKTLREYFQCSDSTIAAARVHCLLFGRGGVPRDNLKFERQCLSPETIASLFEFLNRDDISRASSCRSVMVSGEETAVRYWQDSIKNVIKQYQLEFPNGVKRSYIYSHLPKNFRMNTMLAGLCNVCYDDGYTNFENVAALVGDISKEPGCQDVKSVLTKLKEHQTYLITKYPKQAARHSSCKELCLDFAFGSCEKPHLESSVSFTEYYSICDLLKAAISKVVDSTKREDFSNRLAEFCKIHWQYCSHLLRTKHQAEYYRFVKSNMQPGEVVVVIDYKMKMELGVRTRENQRQWYGKRGLSLHGCYIVAKMLDGSNEAEVLDLWSDDTKQDAWFTQSALDICFKKIESRFPGFSVYLFSDNGPHYHNTGVELYLAEVNEAFDLTLVEHNFFEAGEGKSLLDTHFAHISHKIIRWVRVGNDLESGEQLESLIESMKNVKCCKLQINRQKAPKSTTTFANISTFANFKFPTDGEFKGGILAQSLAGIGKVSSKKKNKRGKIAGQTGSSVSESDGFPASDSTEGSVLDGKETETYTVKFIQFVPDPVSLPLLEPLSDDYDTRYPRPAEGFALKKTSGVRTVFTQLQKEIMIEFFNRQYSTNIRSRPEEVIEAMKSQGEKPLKASQITSFWSTHSQKRKRMMETLERQLNSANNTDEPENATESHQHPSTSSESSQLRANAQPTSVEYAPPSITFVCDLCSNPTEVKTNATLMEWLFPSTFSQSTLNERMGSNACVFIALSCAHNVAQRNMPFPESSQLSHSWCHLLYEAMEEGNNIHEELFDFEGTNVTVEEAVEMSAEQLGVTSLGTKNDLFGRDIEQEFNQLMSNLSNAKTAASAVIISGGRAMLFLFSSQGEVLCFDSHLHGDNGAVLARGSSEEIVKWFLEMQQSTWNVTMTTCSVTQVYF